ncbi:MAG: TonB family protein [Rhodothermales bacterium]|nr:TonB family protein [Rhodothermales bacterium]
MFNDLTLLGARALDAFWLPVAVWSALAAGALLLDARRSVRAPLVRRDVLVLVLAALPLGLLLRPILALRAALPVPFPAPAAEALDVLVPSTPAPVAVPSLPFSFATVAGVAAVLALAATFLGLLRLALDAVRLRRWLHRAAPRFDDRVADLADGYVPPGTRVLVTDLPGAVPLAYGLFAPKVVLPAALLDAPDDARLALLHETVHLEHDDPRATLFAALLGALFVWHPLVVRITRRLELLRELAADAAVLAEKPQQRRAYADLLVRFADRAAHAQPPTPALAAAMAGRPSHLHARLTAMQTPVRLRRAPLLNLLVFGTAALGLVVPAFAKRSPLHSSSRSFLASLIPFPSLDSVYTRPLERITGMLPVFSNPEAEHLPYHVAVAVLLVAPDGSVRETIVEHASTQRVLDATEEALTSWRFPLSSSPNDRLVAVELLARTDQYPRLNVSSSELIGVDALSFFGTIKNIPPTVGFSQRMLQRWASQAGQMPLLNDGSPTAPMPRLNDGSPTAPMPGATPRPAAPTYAPALRQLLDRQLRAAAADTVPVLLDMPTPVYPEILRRAGIGGSVTVRLRVDAFGRVSEASILRSDNDGFNEAALAAARGARFRPAERNGRAVPAEVVLPVQFTPPPSNLRHEATPEDARPPDFVELDRMPQALTMPQPVHPQDLKDAGIEGRVVVRAWIGQDGTVKEVQVLRTDDPRFNAPAVEAVRQWTFTPGMKNGQPVETWLPIPIRFRLNP